MESVEDAFDREHALVFGIGGSGDVVGAIPTARLLEGHGVEVTLGGIPWEPAPQDPVVGPRSFDEIEHVERVSDTVGLATGDTRTHDGIAFTETHVAAHYDQPVALVDITRGAEGMIDGIDEACGALDIDLVVGTDSGGDVLARGDEPGLRSPVTDGLGLVALDGITTESMLGVFGYGSDGELAPDELDAGVARAAERDGLLGAWGLTPRVRTEMEGVLEVVSTEASRLPVEASRGAVGERTIRGGEVSLRLTPPSVVTFYFDPAAVAATSELAGYVRGSRSLDEIRDAFEDAGVTTEFEREEHRLAEE